MVESNNEASEDSISKLSRTETVLSCEDEGEAENCQVIISSLTEDEKEKMTNFDPNMPLRYLRAEKVSVIKPLQTEI